jgi:hypothetical protein
MSDKRMEGRQRKLKSASIVYNNLTSVYSCTLRNLSPTGACLTVTSPLTVPAEFELLIEGERRPCTVAWRRADRIGVRFRQTQTPPVREA